MGEKKCTVDAAARLLVRLEAAARHPDLAVVTALVDINKRFDRVPWRKLVAAAQRYGFPTTILRMALLMHHAPRR
eukprot:6229583-Pyramimonas_sp.AAC.1